MKFALSLSLSIFTVASLAYQSPVFAVDSMAEAYLLQGKRAFDRGDLIAAKRLFNMAALNADKAFASNLHRASIYNNAGEVYRRLVNNKFHGDRWDKVDESAADHLERILPDREMDMVIPPQTPAWLAVHYLKFALTLKEQELGTSSIEICGGLENLAALYSILPRLDEAEALYRRSISIREARDGVNSINSAPAMYKLADCIRLNAKSRLDEQAAIVDLRETCDLLERCSLIWSQNKGYVEQQGGANQKLALTYYQLSDLISSNECLDKCEYWYDKAEQLLKPSSPKSNDAYEYFKKELYPVAQYAYEQRWAQFKQRYKKGKNTVRDLAVLKRACSRIGKLEESKELSIFFNKPN